MSSCEHSGGMTVEYLLVFPFGDLAIFFTFLGNIFVVFILQVPKRHEAVDMPSINSVRDVSLRLPDVIVACGSPLDIVNNCFGLTFPIEHAFPVYLGTSACALMVFVCLLRIDLAVFLCSWACISHPRTLSGHSLRSIVLLSSGADHDTF